MIFIDMKTFEILIESFDLDGVGEVEITWDFDEDEYKETLEELEVGESYSVDSYIKEYVTFNVETFDCETYHHISYETLDYNDLEETFGEKKTLQIIDDLKENGTSRFEISELYNDLDYDVHNPDELNDIAMKLLKHGEYYKDCRGFILSNGVVVYTPLEHNMVSVIDGVNGTFDFIKLGNIRVLQKSIDLCKKPTIEQRETLRRVIGSYANDELYLDIFGENGGEVGCRYYRPVYRRVMAEIDRYFDEGIKPQGDGYNESLKRRNVIISESQYQKFFGDSVEICGFPDDAELYINNEKVAEYKYSDSKAFPFIIFNNQLYIGEHGSTHSQLLYANKVIDDESGIYGRIWVGAKVNEFNHALVLFWGNINENEEKTNCKDKIYELTRKLKVNPDKVVIGVEFKYRIFKLVPLNGWNGTVHEMSDNEKEALNIHLMNSDEKMKQTKGFRDLRDKKIGKKLTNDKGDEIPMAKYHNLIYQENFRNKNAIISEKQYKRFFVRK